MNEKPKGIAAEAEIRLDFRWAHGIIPARLSLFVLRYFSLDYFFQDPFLNLFKFAACAARRIF